MLSVLPSATAAASPRLPSRVCPGPGEHCGAAKQSLMACPAEQVKDLPVLRTHARPMARERRNVKVSPISKLPLSQHAKPRHVRQPAHVRADNVSPVLPIAHGKIGIINHVPATRASDLIKPPVVRRHIHVGATEYQ